MTEVPKDSPLPQLEYTSITNREFYLYVYDLNKGLFFSPNRKRGHAMLTDENKLTNVVVAGRLYRKGVNLYFDTTSGDNIERIDWNESFSPVYVFEQLLRNHPTLLLKDEGSLGPSIAID